jgi:ABC-2 type transport system permease protein
MTNPRSGAMGMARREARGFFSSPAGWTIAAVFALVAGLVFVGLLIRFRQAGLSLAQSSQVKPGEIGLHVSDWVVRPYLFNLGSVLLFFIPLLTMRSIAEERRSGSLEMLFSLPLRGSDIVLGKFVGAMACLAGLLAVVPLHGFFLAVVSTPDWGSAAVGTLGLLLLGVFMLSLGILISTLSQSQIEAGVLTLGILLLLGLGPSVTEAVSPGLAHVLDYVAVLNRFEDFTRGVIDLRHVAFFLGGTLLWLALALRSLDLLRWRGI